MKKILFAAYSLDVGGIETALVTLINYLAEKEYDITLVLEKKQGIFLDEISKKVKIIEYTPSYNKNKVIAKIKNGLNRIKFSMEHKDKYDCAISFATYSLSSSFVARTASKNSVLWVHNNYLKFFGDNENEYIKFFEDINAKLFEKIVFVSEESKNDFEERFSQLKNKLEVCNNLIDYKKIISKSEEKVEFSRGEEITFLNIGRHDEKQKKLSTLIEASKKLNDDGYNFKVLFVGDGEDSEKYKNQVENFNLQDKIIFLGSKKNPYPYFKLCDSVILTSDFEGYPVVYVESLTLEKPIITTDVSDSEKDIKDKYGLVCEKDVNDIYEKMKLFINEGFKIKQKFSPEEFNKEIIKKVEKIICEGKNEIN